MATEMENDESGVKVPNCQINYNTVGATAGIASFLGLNARNLFGGGWGVNPGPGPEGGYGRSGRPNDFEHDFVTELELNYSKELAKLETENSILLAKKYADDHIIDAYKDSVSRFKEADLKIQNVVKDVTASFIESSKQQAVMETKLECMLERMNNMKENFSTALDHLNQYLNGKIDNTAVNLGLTINCLSQKVDYQNQALDNKINSEVNALNAHIGCVKKELIGAIALESERRECGDKNIYNYVNGTFVPGNLYIPSTSVSPEPMNKYNSWTAPTNTTN